MKCLRETIFILLMVFLALNKSHAIPTKASPPKSARNGKFMAFTAHDMFSDMLDDVQDPLPIAGTINEKEKFYRSNDTIKSTTIRPSKINDTKMTKLPIKTEEKIALYNQNTGKFELITTTSGHFSFPMKPVTENGIFVYGGQHYQYQRPVEPVNGGNRTEEIKIFWSSVGDAVESIPFLPIQINVPDMITAMTNFFVNYIPFINRITNPNHPRLPYQMPPKKNHTEHMEYYDNYDVHLANENSLNKREFEDGIKLEEKSSKEKKKNKKKSNKKKNSKRGTSKKIFQRPAFKQTTSAPVEDVKIWHQFGSDTNEKIRVKNMPITRKRVRVTDREVFNFKNSDISNSPIMIVNVPHRPITHYKLSHQELREAKQPTPSPSPSPSSTFGRQQQQQQQPAKEKAAKAPVKQRRKVRNDSKNKKSYKRSGRSDTQHDKPEISTKSAS